MKMTNLQKRALAAAVYFPLLLISCFMSNFFAAFISFLLFAAWHEYLSFKSVPGNTTGWTNHFLICLLGSLPAILMCLGYEPLLGIAFICIFLLIKVMKDLAATSQWKESIEKSQDLLLGWVYLTGCFTLLLYLQLKGGPQSLLFLFLVVGAADTGAYFGGKFLGKTPFFPTMSPKKTLEGFYTGMISAVVVAVVFSLFVKKYDYTAPPFLLAMILGAAVAVASAFGDLFESSMKRHFGVKDSGNIIPGHGGVLDRFDGVLFGAVPLFFYVVLFLGFK